MYTHLAQIENQSSNQHRIGLILCADGQCSQSLRWIHSETSYISPFINFIGSPSTHLFPPSRYPNSSLLANSAKEVYNNTDTAALLKRRPGSTLAESIRKHYSVALAIANATPRSPCHGSKADKVRYYAQGTTSFLITLPLTEHRH